MFYTTAEKTAMATKLAELPIERIAERFGNEYKFLYENNVAGADEATIAGDEIIWDETLRPQLKRLVEFREDMVTSDREAAALAFTFSAVIDDTPDPLTGEHLC